MEEVEDSSEGSDKDLYTGLRIVQQPPPTVSNAKQMCRDWKSNLVDWKKNLTEEAKELNLPKTNWKICCCKFPALTQWPIRYFGSKKLVQMERNVSSQL